MCFFCTVAVTCMVLGLDLTCLSVTHQRVCLREHCHYALSTVYVVHPLLDFLNIPVLVFTHARRSYSILHTFNLCVMQQNTTDTCISIYMHILVRRQQPSLPCMVLMWGHRFVFRLHHLCCSIPHLAVVVFEVV